MSLKVKMIAQIKSQQLKCKQHKAFISKVFDQYPHFQSFNHTTQQLTDLLKFAESDGISITISPETNFNLSWVEQELKGKFCSCSAKAVGMCYSCRQPLCGDHFHVRGDFFICEECNKLQTHQLIFKRKTFG